MKTKKQQGFTIMELIIVTTMLGALAAYAYVKYSNFNNNARTSTLQSLTGGIEAAAEMVRGIAVAKGLSGVVPLSTGNNVTINDNYYPHANSSGITRALTSISGFTPYYEEANNATFRKDGIIDCSVTYNLDNTAPNVTYDDSSC